MGSCKKKKEFSTSPFRQLKGLCVSGKEPVAHPATPSPPQRSPEPDVDFAGEMSRLGVKRARAGEVVPPTPAAKEPQAPVAAVPPDDCDLFLAAIGRLETTFADELPALPATPATPRLKKLLQNDRFAPDGELDLHGFDRQRARERVGYFLDDAVYQGKKAVLLITGRGHGSTGEPVLRNEVESFLLHDAAPWVTEWVRAPRRFGGDGAFVVLLRGKKKE